MRIWSLHPAHLDSRGLVALWRETLLAKHVLEGRTKGYANHPQLLRFKNLKDSQGALNQYLHEVFAEASARGYKFDRSKIGSFRKQKLTVTQGQFHFEVCHLESKLQKRDTEKLTENRKRGYMTHPLFTIIQGGVEKWEKTEA